MFELYFRGMVSTAMTATIPITSIAILSVLYDGLLDMPHKAIKITTKALNPKSTDKAIATLSLFQKNCPTRQANKGKNQITIKISHPSIVCERIIQWVNPMRNNPIGTTRTISCQNFSADFNDFIFLLLKIITIQSRKLYRIPSLSTALSPVAANGEAAWRRRGEHYRSLEPQTVNSTQKVIRSYTPACAKPLVICWHFVNYLLDSFIA